MNIVRAFGYLVMAGGFGVLILFALNVQELTKTFDFSPLELLPIAAVLLMIGYGLVLYGGTYDCEVETY